MAIDSVNVVFPFGEIDQVDVPVINVPNWNVDLLTEAAPASTDWIGGRDTSASTYAKFAASRLAALALGNSGYASGRYYLPYGAYPSTNAAALTANRVYYFPFCVGARATFTKLGAEVVSAGGTYFKLGIYGFANAIPTSRIIDSGNLDSTTTGLKEATISWTPNPGFYALAIIADSATPTFRFANFSVSMMGQLLGFPQISTGANYNGHYQSPGSFTLPSTAGSLVDYAGAPFSVYLKL